MELDYNGKTLIENWATFFPSGGYLAIGLFLTMALLLWIGNQFAFRSMDLQVEARQSKTAGTDIFSENLSKKINKLDSVHEKFSFVAFAILCLSILSIPLGLFGVWDSYWTGYKEHQSAQVASEIKETYGISLTDEQALKLAVETTGTNSKDGDILLSSPIEVSFESEETVAVHLRLLESYELVYSNKTSEDFLNHFEYESELEEEELKKSVSSLKVLPQEK